MAITSIQNQSYIEVQNNGLAVLPAYNSPILLTCKDNQGNTIPKTIVNIIALAVGNTLNIMLPSIESLGNDLNCEIEFIIKRNLDKIQISSFDDGINPVLDTIGQNVNLGISSGTYTSGAVLTFRPAYEGYWTYSVTEN